MLGVGVCGSWGGLDVSGGCVGKAESHVLGEGFS